MNDLLPPDVVENVRLCMGHVRQSNQVDNPWCLRTSSGKFTVKSAWEIIRNRAAPEDAFKHIWVKGLPFKISFFGWRVWTAKVPVAPVLATWNPNISQRCTCCSDPTRETIEHLFLQGSLASSV
ncbi:hypothetical protein KY284_020329 [Solanum tuberosum]|uniref:RNase H family protein n=1 Tax=Solanum tuberosum TaxID=4113 RepID=M1D7D6_SOLTU|nr:hypothetical protein KY284_020329 [Solanum tuberosum]